jgi:hypothetical protein
VTTDPWSVLHLHHLRALTQKLTRLQQPGNIPVLIRARPTREEAVHARGTHNEQAPGRRVTTAGAARAHGAGESSLSDAPTAMGAGTIAWVGRRASAR